VPGRSALITGVAGFLGSTLADRLVADGWRVRGLDRFTAYYEESVKRANVAALASHPRFELIEADLLTADLPPMLDGVDVVFHEAGQPGIRRSWDDGFALYNELNVNVTQRLLEAVRRHPVERLVFASSSSVYGRTSRPSVSERDPTVPFNPYGVTKLTAELLCGAYAANFGVPAVSLRYFTVYGPRQRPDMAIHRMIEAARSGRPFPVYGDGTQVRDFTFVDDAVDATVRAACADVAPGSAINVAGGASASLRDVIDLVGDAVGEPVPVTSSGPQAGDVPRTGGDISLAMERLGWTPRVGLPEGITRQVAWQLAR
jgi:nucleoside-diphosphate-sugar epimerase